MAPTVEAQSHATSGLRDAPVSQKQGWRGLWTSREVSEMEGSERLREEVQGSAVHKQKFDVPPYNEELQGSAVERQKLPLPPHSEELEGSPGIQKH